MILKNIKSGFIRKWNIMDKSKAVKKGSQLQKDTYLRNVKVESTFKWICLAGVENLVLQHGEDVGYHLSMGRA